MYNVAVYEALMFLFGFVQCASFHCWPPIFCLPRCSLRLRPPRAGHHFPTWLSDQRICRRRLEGGETGLVEVCGVLGPGSAWSEDDWTALPM